MQSVVQGGGLVQPVVQGGGGVGAASSAGWGGLVQPVMHAWRGQVESEVSAGCRRVELGGEHVVQSRPPRAPRHLGPCLVPCHTPERLSFASRMLRRHLS